MKRGQKTLLVLAIGYAILLVAFFVHQAFFVPQREVIASMMNAWDFLQTLIRVMAWAPALTATAILLVFGLVPDSPEGEGGRQGYMAKLRGPLIVVGISSFVYAIVMAWAIPAAKGESARILSASRTFTAAVSAAEEAAKAQDWKTASLQLSIAQAIDDHDKRYMAQQALYNKRPAAREVPPEDTKASIGARAGQSATRYYEQALLAFDQGEFYLAHSLATLSHRIDPGREESQRLASKAWDQIAILGASEEEIAQRRFAAAKQAAYKALRAEDYIDAYGRFLDLQKLAPKDPDVKRYVDESLEGVRSISFFQDEVNRLSLRPASDKVFFRVANKDGKDSFMAARAVYTGPEIAYARDFEFIVLDQGVPSLHVASPYAKIQDLRILLAAYDRENPANGLLPDFKVGGSSASIKSYLETPIRIKDLREALIATRAPADLGALDLFTAIRRAPDFALDARPFMREAFNRVQVILAFLILCVLALFMGYRFRYRGAKAPVVELVIAAPMAWFASSLSFQAWAWLNGLWLDISLSFAPPIAVILFSITQAAAVALVFVLLAGHRDRPTD